MVTGFSIFWAVSWEFSSASWGQAIWELIFINILNTISRSLSLQCTFFAHRIGKRNLILRLSKYLFPPTKKNIFLSLCKLWHINVLKSYIMHGTFQQHQHRNVCYLAGYLYIGWFVPGSQWLTRAEQPVQRHQRTRRWWNRHLNLHSRPGISQSTGDGS